MERLPGFSGLTAFYAAARHGTLTEAAADRPVSDPFALAATGTLSREPIPHLSEPWYC